MHVVLLIEKCITAGDSLQPVISTTREGALASVHSRNMRTSVAMGTKEMWLAYVAFLEREVPASFANLAPGASEADIASLEQTLGLTLPEPVKAVWRLNDGQKKTMLADGEDAATPCIPTLSFLSTKAVARIWKDWAEVRKSSGAELDAGTRSAVPGVVKALYSSPGWIPLWAHPSSADYVGLDLDPGEKGQPGQIINFGRDEDEHFQFATDFDDLLSFLLEEVRAGRWEADVFEPDDEDEDEVEWFGDPDESFFNTLHGRWKKRNPPPPRKKTETAAATPRGERR